MYVLCVFPARFLQTSKIIIGFTAKSKLIETIEFPLKLLTAFMVGVVVVVVASCAVEVGVMTDSSGASDVS